MLIIYETASKIVDIEIVMQYLCLFYGSDNPMYTNECVNQEDVKDPNPANHKVAPRPPCRSFCVQVH